jgi:hypothetical protein
VSLDFVQLDPNMFNLSHFDVWLSWWVCSA